MGYLRGTPFLKPTDMNMPETERKPLKSGRLSREQVDQALRWFFERIGEQPDCPMCGHQDWELPPFIGAIRIGGELIGGKSFPVVSLICHHCGHQLFFNAVVMGLAEPEALEEDDA